VKYLYKNTVIGFIIFFNLAYCQNLWAKVGISVGSGYGVAEIVPIRLGVQKEFEKKWLSPEHWPIEGYWEASVYSLNGRAGSNPSSNHRLTAGALAGVFRFLREKQLMQGWPYFEIGIGASYLSKKEIGGKNLGIHFQFEDRVGVGLRFGEKRQYDIGYKFFHFSNAYLGRCNHGLNLHMIVLGYWFH